MLSRFHKNQNIAFVLLNYRLLSYHKKKYILVCMYGEIVESVRIQILKDIMRLFYQKRVYFEFQNIVNFVDFHVLEQSVTNILTKNIEKQFVVAKSI